MLPRGRLLATSRYGKTLLAVMGVLMTALARTHQGVRRYLSRLVKEVSHCRECGHPVNLLRDDICERCGAGKPIRVSISPSVLVTAAACELTLILLQLL